MDQRNYEGTTCFFSSLSCSLCKKEHAAGTNAVRLHLPCLDMNCTERAEHLDTGTEKKLPQTNQERLRQTLQLVSPV